MAIGSTDDEKNLPHIEVVSGILAHDLKNPLAAVLMNARMLRGEESERARAIGARIVTSGERIARMIDQILEWTRSRAGGSPIGISRVACDLGQIVAEAVAELRRCKGEIPIAVEARGDLRGCWDVDRLAQVVSNLVGNALEHATLPGVAISVAGQDEEVTLAVRNEGRIDADLVPVLFQPFGDRTNRASRRGRGLGLGLYITREIVLAHGGGIDVEVSREPPGNVSFVVRLPRAC